MSLYLKLQSEIGVNFQIYPSMERIMMVTLEFN